MSFTMYTGFHIIITNKETLVISSCYLETRPSISLRGKSCLKHEDWLWSWPSGYGGLLSPGVKWLGVWRWSHNVHMLQTLRMGGAIPLFPPPAVPWWHVQEQIYIVFIVSVVTLTHLKIYLFFFFQIFTSLFPDISLVPLATDTNSTPSNSLSVIPSRFSQICAVWTEMSHWRLVNDFQVLNFIAHAKYIINSLL